jgi:hypothetical protein
MTHFPIDRRRGAAAGNVRQPGARFQDRWARRPAILYDAPSTKGGKLFVAPRGMPLEVVLGYGDWVKVRDASGDLAWTEAKALSSQAQRRVRAANTKVRATADDSAARSSLPTRACCWSWRKWPATAGSRCATATARPAM